jgi:hypothetical protein
MAGRDLDVLLATTAVAVFIFDPKIGKVHLLVEVRQTVFVRPRLNLLRLAR